MSLSRMPSGRWRAQINHRGRNVSVPKIIGGPASYATKREARAAREKARLVLAGRGSSSSVTVREFWERWTTDPLFRRPKESTQFHNWKMTRAFVERYGSLPIDSVDDRIVSEWVALHVATVASLRAMFNDARSGKAGRLIAVNPFADLGLRRSRGNAGKDPPSEETVRALIAAAYGLTTPSFAAWLQTACFTGMRPGELDALRWSAVDLDAGIIHVREQVSNVSRRITSPKSGLARDVVLVDEARRAILSVARTSEFVFVNLRNEHWTASSRQYHWRAVRAAVGFEGSLYLTTRHFAGSFMTNVLLLPAEDVAIQLGHQDGGALVRSTYGHRSTAEALERVRAAYAARGNVTPLRVIRGESA